MENEEDPWDDDTEIDVEVWLQALLAMTGDKKRRERLIRGICERTGLPPEKAELVISTTINILSEKARSN